MKVLCLAIVAGLPLCGLAQTLSTTTPNNGSGGVFFNLTAASAPLEFTGFQTYYSSASGTPVQVQVYSRPGSYQGFEGSNAGWTLVETVNAVSAGSTVLSGTAMLANPISLPASQTVGLYLHAITAGGGIRYTGTNTAPPQTNWSNADLALFSAHTRTGAVAFGGTLFTVRCFAGTIHYQSVVPEPATFATMGIGALFLMRRRRK